MFKRLRNQFIIMHMVIVSSIVAVFFGAVIFVARNRIDQSIQRMLTRNNMPFGGRFPPPDMLIREVDTLRHLAYTFLLVAIPLLALIFWASLYFANRSIRPIERSFIKQKEFVADASHELKTPLATISTNADVLLAVADKPAKKWARHIKTESERMTSLVGSLLYLARIDYDDQPLFAPVDLCETLRDVLLPLEAVIHENNVNLQVNCVDDAVVNADATQIHRLFGILLDNAIKYTNGEISVSIEKTAHNAKITVRNSGEVIPPEKLAKLFDRFYRADESHQYTGSFGLGLSIAKAIVNKHKGEITCSSDTENGTQFKVALRLAG